MTASSLDNVVPRLEVKPPIQPTGKYIHKCTMFYQFQNLVFLLLSSHGQIKFKFTFHVTHWLARSQGPWVWRFLHWALSSPICCQPQRERTRHILRTSPACNPLASSQDMYTCQIHIQMSLTMSRTFWKLDDTHTHYIVAPTPTNWADVIGESTWAHLRLWPMHYVAPTPWSPRGATCYVLSEPSWKSTGKDVKMRMHHSMPYIRKTSMTPSFFRIYIDLVALAPPIESSYQWAIIDTIAATNRYYE